MPKFLAISSLVISVFALSITTLCTQAISLPLTDVTPPVLRDIAGRDTIGVLKFITTTIVNGEDFEKQFTVIIEARDATGVTIFLQFQIGRLSALGSSDVGVSWLPDKAGKYELRAFAISNFASPTILTDVRTGQGVFD